LEESVRGDRDVLGSPYNENQAAGHWRGAKALADVRKIHVFGEDDWQKRSAFDNGTDPHFSCKHHKKSIAGREILWNPLGVHVTMPERLFTDPKK
jgi:hypothetical protein